MKKILATCLAVIAFIILPVSAALSDNNEPSGSSDDTQFALRDAGMLLARAGTTGTKTGTGAISGGVTGAGALGNNVGTVTGGATRCGNGSIDAGEECDDGADNGECPKACSTTCHANSPCCGNGRIDAGEECDEGFANNGACPKVCSSECTNNVSCCTPCTIGEHIFTEICSADSCCLRFRNQLFVRLSVLNTCLQGHSYRQFESGTEFIDYPRDECGDRLIYDLPSGGTQEQCDPPFVQGVCASGQICNKVCQCRERATTGPDLEWRPPGPFHSGGIPEALCGNGRPDPGEICDPAAPPRGVSSGFGCPAGQTCDPATCRCSEGATESCRSTVGDHDMGVPRHVCCERTCKGLIACRDSHCPAAGAPLPPFTAESCAMFDAAMAAVAHATVGGDRDCPVPPEGGACIPNGRPEGGEQCDTFELSEAAARAQLLERCTPPADGQEVFNCDMRDCSCAYIQTACAGRTIDGAIVQCRSSLDCAVGNICDSDCQCRTIPPPPPPPPPEPPVAERRQDCSVEVISFSSDAAKEKLDKLNKKEIAEITGRTDLDVYAEREQMARVVCVTKAVSQTAGKGAVTYNGTVSDHVMTSWDNITTSRPMQLIQTGGSVFIDFNNTDQMQFKRVELVEQPVRILPLEGQTGISLSEAVPIGTLLPNITSSVSSTGDAANVNNMIEYQGFNLGAGQTYSFNASGSVDIQNAEGAPVVSGADRIDVFNFRMPIGCATWTGVEGYAGCKPIEEQIHDLSAVKNFIKAQVIPGEFVKSSVVYGAPWEKIDNFTFILDRGAGAPGIPDPGAAAATRGANVAVTATRGGGGIPSTPVGGMGDPFNNSAYDPAGGIATEHKFAILAADPAWLGEGGGGCKGCYVNGTGAGAGEVLPALIAFVTMLGGIVARRVRRK